MFRYLTTTLTTFSAGEQHTPAAGGSNLFNFDDNINNLRPNQLPGALKGICGKDNSGQFEDDFFVNKNTLHFVRYKINKNLELSFVFVQMNAAHCIGGQNKIYDNEYYSGVSFLWDAFL